MTELLGIAKMFIKNICTNKAQLWSTVLLVTILNLKLNLQKGVENSSFRANRRVWKAETTVQKKICKQVSNESTLQ